MTIINFPSPPLIVGETYTENNITYTWDGEKWTALPLTRDSMVPPEIGTVTLTDNNEGGQRLDQGRSWESNVPAHARSFHNLVRVGSLDPYG